MLSINFLTSGQIKSLIAARAKECRLHFDLSRQSLAERSGVPVSTIKRFETLGEISFDSLLRLAAVLDCLQEFNQLFIAKPPVSLSLKDFPVNRQRGRK